MKDISIIIPVFNSASCLQDVVRLVIMAMQKRNASFEIILVDDGSRDTSWEIIKELKEKNENITGVKLSKNYGQHNALLCALDLCIGNYIVTIDDDLEQNPEDIEKLYDKLKQEKNDLVYGMPINRGKSMFRSLFTFIYKRIIRTDNKHAGEGSSFRIFTKELKEKVITHKGSLFFFDEIALWYTDNLGFEKVTYQKSRKINSGYGYSSLFILSMRVLSISSTLPLRFIRVLGFQICAVSIVTGIYFIIRKFFHHAPMGYTSLIVVSLFSTGVVTFSLGIIGEYLGNLISLANNKPPYSVKEKI